MNVIVLNVCCALGLALLFAGGAIAFGVGRALLLLGAVLILLTLYLARWIGVYGQARKGGQPTDERSA
jgi:hypothetical protein